VREYGQVQCAFWRHDEIRALDGVAREFALYLLTGPHSNGIGCYYLPDGYVNADLGWPAETISKSFEALADIRFAHRCQTSSYVLIPDFLKWNEIANPNVARARIKEFGTIPRKSTIYGALCASMKRYGRHWPKDFETVLDGGTKQEPTQPQPEKNLPESIPPKPARGAGETKAPPRKAWGSDEDHALAKRMHEAIKVVVPSAKEPNWDGWANAIRLMREQDERTHDQIWTTFDWANRDGFWRANILSPQTLRDRWNQLEAKRLNQPVRPGTRAPTKQDYGETRKL
jgi:hypothetical protein